jgi:hypothetical protein
MTREQRHKLRRTPIAQHPDLVDELDLDTALTRASYLLRKRTYPQPA